MNVSNYLKKVKSVLDTVSEEHVTLFVELIYKAYRDKKTIFVIGNGGSASSASHLAQDLAKGVLLDQDIEPRIKALSLTDNTAYISALANDDGYDRIFEAQLRTFSNEGDLLIAISGSGNSKNILKAVEFCKKKNIAVLGVTGYDGGALLKNCDFSLHVPLNEMCTVESIHTIIFHYVILALREKITGIKLDNSWMK